MKSLLRHLKALEKQSKKAICQHRRQIYNIPILNLIFQRAKHRSLTPRLKLLLFACAGVIPLSLIASSANAATCGVNGITRISSPVFYIDTGVSPSPQGMYVGYTIKNISGSAYSDLWVKLENFTGTRLGLASTENGIVHVGPLAAGASKTVYFYLMSSGTGNTSTPLQNHTVSLYSTRPDLAAGNICSDPFSLTIEETIKAVANKITTVVSGPNPPELGGVMTMTITGDTGTIGAAGIFAITPGSFIDWPANAYKLVGTQMSLSGGNTGTFNDILYKVLPNSQATDYTLIYTFIATGSTVAPTTVSPINQLSSGTQVKHNDTGSFTSLAPIQPTINNVTLSKSVNTPTMVTGGVVTYTIILKNLGTIPVTLDDIVDQLPISPGAASYITNSAKFNGSAIANPNIAASKLTFLGLFTVPAGGTSTLTYQATIPNTPGTYSNSAVGHIGSTQIDTTTNTSDNVPAIATITIGQGDLSLTKTVDNGTPTVGNNVTYAIAVTNSGPNPTSGVIVKDILPSQVSYVSDDSGGNYNSATGNWNVGSLNNGETKRLKITVKVNSATTFSNTAEVTASSLADPDSTPNNNIANEDDQASVSVTSTALVSISGTVFSDADADVTINGSDAGTNAGSANLTIYVVDTAGKVLDKSIVAANGTYTLTNIPPNSSITLRLSNDSTVAIGATAPTSPSLPSGWYHTGKNLNGTIDGAIATLGNIALTTTTSNLTNQNFGIRQAYTITADPAPTNCNPDYRTALNTGITAAAGQLAVGQYDLNWTAEWIAGPASGPGTPYAPPRPVGVMPAVVVGKLASTWIDEPANVRWISYPFRLSVNSNGYHNDADLDGINGEGNSGFSGLGTSDDVRLKFTSQLTLPSNANTISISLPVGVAIDNQFVSIKVNGVENLVPTPAANPIAADYGTTKNLNITKGWQAGVNTIEVVVDSGPDRVGFFLGVQATTTQVCTNPNVLLVKRITAINGDRTKNPNDNTPLNTFVDDTTSTRKADDNSANWKSNYLLGAIDAGKIKPGDEIEYTIYFLNAGSTNANSVKVCDRISANQNFKVGAYGTSKDVQLQLGTSALLDLTSANDTSDRAQLISADGSFITNCNLKAANDNGTLVIDVTGNAGVPNLTTMPGSTGQGSPNDSYGFLRFVTKVKP